MDSVLIVSSTEKGREMIVSLLKSYGSYNIFTAENASLARRMLNESEYDIIIINSPLRDEFGNDLAIDITSSVMTGVIFIVKSDILQEVETSLEKYGIFVLGKPLNKAMFFQSIKFVNTSRNRILGIKNENIKLQNKIEEIRLVDRAKCVLIQYLNLTESQAHRYIEKQAMDMRSTRLQIAKDILKTYES